MLDSNLFSREEIKDSQVEKSLLTLLDFNKENTKIFKVNTSDEVSSNSKYILSAEDGVQISSIVSNLEDKKVYILNEYFNEILQNINSSLSDNFLKIFRGLSLTVPKFLDKSKNTNVTILNMINDEAKEIKNDVSLLRNLENINIFIPADSMEAEYLLKVSEKGMFNNIQDKFSYFRLNSHFSPKIFSDDFFINEGLLKEYNGLPYNIYISKNVDSPFNLVIISCGPIIYNSLIAAKELEEKGYNVKVVNMSLLHSSSKYINEKIKIFINNLANHNKNILTVEEHSKMGGLGSIISETVAEHRHDSHVRVERLGIEDDLTPRNIIAKCEEIVGF